MEPLILEVHWNIQSPFNIQMTLFLPAEPVSDVTIRANVSETVEQNSTVVLTCSAKGSFLRFLWTNNTTPIIADDKRLTFKEVKLHGFHV